VPFDSSEAIFEPPSGPLAIRISLPFDDGHFDHVLGIPGLFSTLRLRRSAGAMTIHGSRGTLDVLVRMLAGLWGEGRAPIPLELAPAVPFCIILEAEFTSDVPKTAVL
jgi:hypothetical protein